MLTRCIEDRWEIDVEVLFRLGGRTLIVIAHEDIAVASDVVGIPFDGVWPNLERTAIYLIFDGQRLLQELVEILILGSLRHIAGIDVDHFLIVDAALYTKMIFAVFFVLEEILSSGKLLDIVCNTLNKHLQFVKTFINGIDVAEVVGQGLSRSTIRFGEVLLQNLHGTGIRDAACQIYAVATCACEIVGNLAVDGLHDFRHTSHIRVGLQCGVTVHILPVTIIADKTGLFVGYVRVDNLTELCRQRLHDFALALACLDQLEVLEIRRMNGEQRDVVIYVAVHVREILGKLLQMVADILPLLVILVEHTFLGDILHILLRNSQRAVAVVDMEQHLTSELEFWSIVYHFLHTKGDTELRLVCNLSQCLQYLQVAVQLVSTTASFQIGQHFVDDQ